MTYQEYLEEMAMLSTTGFVFEGEYQPTISEEDIITFEALETELNLPDVTIIADDHVNGYGPDAQDSAPIVPKNTGWNIPVWLFDLHINGNVSGIVLG